jgi:hypothetical protein
MSELHFPAPPLADETVLLRPWRETDVADGLMAFSDPIIQRFSWPQAAGSWPGGRLERRPAAGDVGVHHVGAGPDRADLRAGQQSLPAGRGTLRVRV